VKNPQEVRTMESGLITTDSHLVKSFFANNRKKIPDHFLRRIKSSNFFSLNNDVPGPAEKTF